VRPGSFDRKKETEGGAMEIFDDYSVIPKDEIEWYSSRRGCVHPYGLLVRTMAEKDVPYSSKYKGVPMRRDLRVREKPEGSPECIFL